MWTLNHHEAKEMEAVGDLLFCKCASIVVWWVLRNIAQHFPSPAFPSCPVRLKASCWLDPCRALGEYYHVSCVVSCWCVSLTQRQTLDIMLPSCHHLEWVFLSCSFRLLGIPTGEVCRNCWNKQHSLNSSGNKTLFNKHGRI
jgi:hypothetical protein